MVRVVARQHCVRLKCSVVQQRSDAKPWLAVVAAVAYCRRCINAGTRRPASRCNCFKRDFLQSKTRVRAIFAVVLHFCSAHDAHR